MNCKYCNTETTTCICDDCKNHILLIKKNNNITTAEAEKQYMSVWCKRKNNNKEKKNKQIKKQPEYSKYCMYLRSNKWKSVKEQLLKKHKYNPFCFCCGTKKNLCIHHKTYKNIYNENLNDLVYVCTDCHSKIHTIIKAAYKSKDNKFSPLRCHITFKQFFVRCGSSEKAYKHLLGLIKTN